MAALTARGDMERGVDWAQVRAILGLRWRLTAAHMRQKWWRLPLAILGTLLWALLVAGATVGAWFGAAAARENAEIAPLVPAAFHAAYLFLLATLAATPALGLRGNEFLDVTRLFVLPVNHRTVFAATTLGLLTSKSVLFFALPLAAASAGWADDAGGVVAGVLSTMLVTLIGVAGGQAILLLFLDVFRSRKWRDVSRIALALFSSGAYLTFRFGARQLAGGVEGALRAWDRVRDWTLPLPSWWGAHVVSGTSGARFLLLLALGALLAWLVAGAARLQERVYFGEIEEHRSSATEQRGFAAWVGARFRGPLGACVEKDVRVLAREPGIRIQIIQQFSLAVVPLAFAVWQGLSDGGRRGVSIAPSSAGWVAAGLAYFPVLTATALASNPLGTEGPGLQHALLTPARRRTLLLSKAIALGAVVGGVCALLAAGATAAVSAFAFDAGPGATAARAFLAALECVCAFLVFAGAGSVTGAVFPFRMVFRDRRALRQTSTGRAGCLASLARLGALLASGLLTLPVLVAFHHPDLARLADRDSTPFLALSVPLAFAWSVGMLVGGAALGGSLLEGREEAALDVLARSDT